MIEQATLFEPTPVASSKLPPTKPPKPVTVVEPLGLCCKCGEPATVALPDSKHIYCEKCGRCDGNKKVEMTVLGVNVKKCGRSVENFVWHLRLKMWCCPCYVYRELEGEKDEASNIKVS